MTATDDTRTRILDTAQGLIQTLGYEGFSYADVAERVGIRKASIHHYFPKKSDLGIELIERFRGDCLRHLGSLGGEDTVARIEGFVDLFRSTLRSGRMCLCGILAAGFANLTEELKGAVLLAISEQEQWVSRTLEDGQSRGVVRRDLSSEVMARNLLGGLEGALLLARVHGDTGRFEASVRCMIDGIRADSRS